MSKLTLARIAYFVILTLILFAALAFLWMSGPIGEGGLTFENASEEYTTNCDMGPGCGMVPVIKILIIILSVCAIYGAARLFWNRRRSD